MPSIETQAFPLQQDWRNGEDTMWVEFVFAALLYSEGLFLWYPGLLLSPRTTLLELERGLITLRVRSFYYIFVYLLHFLTHQCAIGGNLLVLSLSY